MTSTMSPKAATAPLPLLDSTLNSYVPVDGEHKIVGSPINLGKRKRVGRWLERHHLKRNSERRRRKRHEREIKRGCTALHTSTNRHARAQGSPNFGKLGQDNDAKDDTSFHSCYSYDREGYNWLWYTTASEVLKSYAFSLTSRLENYIHLGVKGNFNSTANSSAQFTPRLDATFKTCLGSEYLNSNNSKENFWTFGEQNFTVNASSLVGLLGSLNSSYPDSRGTLFAPPIHNCSQLGWSEVEEAKFDFPSLRAPQTDEDAATEVAKLSHAMRGHWITLMPRSSDIDEQFKYMGISYAKRSILSRIAIPLTMFLEDKQDDGIFANLHTWIHTPLGLRHINWSTIGEISADTDNDCGTWEGLVRPVSLYIPSMDRSVRALQRIMKRPNDLTVGITMETRCVLPDFQEGRVLFFQIDTYPNAFKSDFVTGAMHVSRILRFEHPVDNVLELTSKTALTEAGALKGCTRLQDEPKITTDAAA